MSDAVPIAILLAAFALAIGLVQVLNRLIDTGGRDGRPDHARLPHTPRLIRRRASIPPP